MTVQRFTLGAAVVLTVTLLVIEFLLAPRMNPIRRATAAEFWETIAGVDISGAPNHHWFGVVTPRDGRFVYNSPGMDDIWIEWIPESEAMAAWPAVEAELEKVSAANPNWAVGIGYQRWKAATVSDRGGIVGLNMAISAAISEKAYRENPKRLVTGDVFTSERLAVESTAPKLNWYWATVCFDFLFLSGLVWWLLWPAMKGSSFLRYLVHGGLAPILFVLPNWLGYAIRVPNVEQSGGVLYTWLLMLIGNPYFFFNWEVTFLSHLPPILEPLSQHAWVDPWGPHGLILIQTQHGPVSVMLASAGMMVIAGISRHAIKFNIQPWLEKHRPHGFDVISAGPVSPQVFPHKNHKNP